MPLLGKGREVMFEPRGSARTSRATSKCGGGGAHGSARAGMKGREQNARHGPAGLNTQQPLCLPALLISSTVTNVPYARETDVGLQLQGCLSPFMKQRF